MRLYELVLVLKASLSEAERKKLIDNVKEWLGKNVKVTKEESWGQKPLAYKIKNELAGFYHVLHLESDEEKGVEKGFEKRLMANDKILRFLLLRTK